MTTSSATVTQEIQAYAAKEAGGKLEPFEYSPGELKPREVEIQIAACGICHSDLSMLKNEWQMTQYPFVPGHEVAGTVAAVGSDVTTVKVGQKVGLGWFAKSCMSCDECMAGDHNLCLKNEHLIVGRYGGFANRVRASEEWTIPLPDEIDLEIAGPLFCGGITVFNPIVQSNLSPTARVGVIGIGGLGHLALQFLNAWGCEVTAFSSSPAKEEEARKLGAHHFVSSRDSEALAKQANSFDWILNTVNVSLDWDTYIQALKPRGTFFFVGAAYQVTATVFPMIIGQKKIAGSPLGSPRTMAQMLDFAVLHNIRPKTQTFAMADVNEAFDALENQKPGHRLVLSNAS